jgi:hypothetical protein
MDRIITAGVDIADSRLEVAVYQWNGQDACLISFSHEGGPITDAQELIDGLSPAR